MAICVTSVFRLFRMWSQAVFVASSKQTMTTVMKSVRLNWVDAHKKPCFITSAI